jgi:hypothetical protein
MIEARFQSGYTIYTITLQTNTYQALIITDTFQSYYFFNYTCGGIEWSGRGSGTAIVGYNSRADYFSNHPANGFSDIGRIVSCTRQIIPERRKKRQNAVVSGALSGPLPANPLARMNIARCNGIADSDDINIPDISNIVNKIGETVNAVDEVEHCPPIRTLIEFSTLFTSFPERQGNCFRSRKMYIPDGRYLQRLYYFISVCCYDSNR